MVADDNKTFNECLIDLEKVTLAEVPTTEKDKEGAKASDSEIAEIDFIELHIEKIKGSLPADFDKTILLSLRDLIKEKKRQSAELKRLEKAIQAQVTCLRIKIKADIQEVYGASEKAAKKDISLKYIYDRLAVLYARLPTKSTDTDTKNTTAAAK